MTREIKFRAWDKENKNWLYFVIYPTKENIEHTISFGSPIHKLLIDQDRIDRKSWCQYIGLKDKKGVEIYEGDIVQVMNLEGNKIAHKRVVSMDNYENMRALEFYINYGDPYEIIGNIYENKDLLK